MTSTPSAPARGGASDAPAPTTGELTLVVAARIVLEQRRLVFGLPLALATLAVIVSLLWFRTYSASASFVPQSTPGALSGLASLASQYGVTLPGSDQSETPDFYADLLTSSQVLRAVVETNYDLLVDGDSLKGNLISFYGISESTPERSREKAVKKLRDHLTVSVGLKTGVVTLVVRARSAPLALAIAQRALECVNTFNLQSRQSQASAQRVFIESRVVSAAQELREAEDRLQDFLQRNRDFSGAPQLAFQHDRLQRDVTMRQEVYTNLMQALEQSKIEEVRNTPVITMVEQPILPAEPDSRYIVLKVLLALTLGGLIGVGAAFAREFLGGNTQIGPVQREDLARLRRETLADLRRPWLLFRRKAPLGGPGS